MAEASEPLLDGGPQAHGLEGLVDGALVPLEAIERHARHPPRDLERLRVEGHLGEDLIDEPQAIGLGRIGRCRPYRLRARARWPMSQGMIMVAMPLEKRASTAPNLASSEA